MRVADMLSCSFDFVIRFQKRIVVGSLLPVHSKPHEINYPGDPVSLDIQLDLLFCTYILRHEGISVRLSKFPISLLIGTLVQEA